MASHPLDALVDAASQDKRKDAKSTVSSGLPKSPVLQSSAAEDAQLDSLSELKRKFKDVLRAYWRQHKIHHEGEDTDQYDVAFRIATNIFNLYWDKPNYAGLKGDKKEILNYFIKHIQLSKSREGQLANLPSGPARGKVETRPVSSEPTSMQDDFNSYLSGRPTRRVNTDLTAPTLLGRPGQPPSSFSRSDASKYPVPRSEEQLRALREIIPDAQLPFSLLVDGVPATIPEAAVRSELLVVLHSQFGVKPVISVINLQTPLYHILLNSAEECDTLAGHNIRLTYSGFHTLYRLPPLPSKKRKGGDLDDYTTTLQSKKPKLAIPEDIATTAGPLPIFHATSAFVRPAAVPSTAPADDHYFVERVLHQRAVHNKIQYLLQLRGENSTLKVWMFDEDLFSGIDSNRKAMNAWTGTQTGVWPEPHLLPDVEQIIGAKMVNSQLMFYVKWANSSIYALVPSSIVNKAAPAKVIQFYEARLSFDPSPLQQDQPLSPPQVSSPTSFSETSAPASSSSSVMETTKSPNVGTPTPPTVLL